MNTIEAEDPGGMAYFFDQDEREARTGEKRSSEPDFSPSKKDFESFRIRLHQEILRSGRHKYSFALMRVAIDSPEQAPQRTFTPAEIAMALKSAIREYDVLCALRADEFLIAFPETEEQQVEQIAGRIRQTVEQKVWAGAVDEAYQANIGIACFPQDGTNEEDLLHSAEHDLRIARKMHRR